MTVLKLAWRNVWRNPRRTALTLMAIAFAASVLIFFIGLQLSSYEAMIDATVSVYHGQLQVQRHGYHAKPQFHLTVDNANELKHTLSERLHTSRISLRANGFGIVSSASRVYGTQIIGVEPESETLVSSIPGLVRTGRYLERTSRAEAVIGESLATNLQVKIGDELTILGHGAHGSLAATVVQIVGIFESGARELDRSMIQLPLPFFQETFGIDDAAHALVIQGLKLSEVEHVQQEISTMLDSKLVLLRWDELIPGVKEAIELDMASGWLFYASLVLVVTFSVINTFLMSVLERTREFGIMLALGCSPRNLGGFILAECMLLTTLGLLLGALIGSMIILYFGVHGFSIPGTEEILAHWNLPSSIKTKLSAGALLYGPSVIFFASLIGALYPVWRAKKIRMVEAIYLR